MAKKILGIIAIGILFNACVVSKKKYEALLSEKTEISKELSDKKKENKSLQKDLSQAVGDFEKMKYDFSKSNALKSDEISDLMIQITQLKDNTKNLNEKLDETINQFKAKEKANYEVGEELTAARSSLLKLKRDTASLQYTLKLARERNDQMQKEIMTTQQKLTASGNKSLQMQKDLEAQTKKMKQFEMQLVKNEQKLSEISDNFIALRKALLSAKSSNKPIDPNKSKQIDKIARLLGHY